MTPHDRSRQERAEQYLRDEQAGRFVTLEEQRSALLCALAGLMSTDDPSLVPMWESFHTKLESFDRDHPEVEGD